MANEIIKELQQRGTAEVNSGIINQVTQALDESEEEVKYLLFGELKSQRIIPIDVACAKCSFWKGKFESTSKCQERQAQDGRARGFRRLICPEQFQN